MNLTALQSLGLSDQEITTYQTLLTGGTLAVSDIITRTKLKKGDTYNKLALLEERGLIEKVEVAKIRHYRVTDPAKIEQTIQARFQEALQAKNSIEAVMPLLSSAYNLSSEQPGITLFEGEEAMTRILEDSLTSQGDILEYVDLETVLGSYPELNKLYAKRRASLGIRKRIILPDNQVSRDYAHSVDPKLTEFRLVKHPLPKFATVMQIYNDRISYLTLKPKTMIGLIIVEPLISKMHTAFFETMWSEATPLPRPEPGAQKP